MLVATFFPFTSFGKVSVSGRVIVDMYRCLGVMILVITRGMFYLLPCIVILIRLTFFVDEAELGDPHCF